MKAIDAHVLPLASELKKLGASWRVVIEGGPEERGRIATALASHLGLAIHRVAATQTSFIQATANARAGNSILFFDEADSLFGKRSTVKDAHDRYVQLLQLNAPVFLGVERAESLPPGLLTTCRKITAHPPFC